MLTRDARIAAFKDKAAELLRQATKLEEDKAKEQADADRKADAAAKLLLGVGVLLLDPPEQTRTVAAILGRLGPRDRGRVQAWAKTRGLDLAASATADSAVVSTPGVDVEAAALKRVIGCFDAGNLSLLATEVLGASEGEDRAVLERYFARLTEPARGETDVCEAVASLAS